MFFFRVVDFFMSMIFFFSLEYFCFVHNVSRHENFLLEKVNLPFFPEKSLFRIGLAIGRSLNFNQPMKTQKIQVYLLWYLHLFASKSKTPIRSFSTNFAFLSKIRRLNTWQEIQKSNISVSTISFIWRKVIFGHV